MPHFRKKNCRAFTLMELLLSTSMLALMMAALFSSQHTALKALRAGRSRFALLRRAIITVSHLRRYICAASPYKQRNPKTEFNGTSDSLIFVTLTRDSILNMAPLSVIIESADGKLILSRHPLAHLVKELKKSEFLEIPLPGIASMEFAYSDDGSEWIDKWKLASKGHLPRAVRLRFTVKSDDSDNTMKLEEIIRIEGARTPKLL